MGKIVIGTRSSPLALYQAGYIRDQLLKIDGVTEVTLSKIKTTGDKILDVPLARVGGKGLFVKEIEEALLRGDIDLAVHSMKDVPVEFPEGLGLTAVSVREDPRDALVTGTENGPGFNDLPKGARIGTSSLRRKAQLLNARPDLEMLDIRGNVQTRLKKLKTEHLDGTILAAAGLKRLGLADMITEYLPVSLSLPAIGQGIMGVESQLADDKMLAILAKINHKETAYILAAERAYLARLEGGCQVPIGAYAIMKNGTIILSGFVGSVDGTTVIRNQATGDLDDAEALGVRLADRMLADGAGEILKEVENNG